MAQRRIVAIVVFQLALISQLVCDTQAQPSRASSTRGRGSYRPSGTTTGGRGGFYGFNSHEEAARRAVLEQRAAEEAYQEALKKRELIKEGKLEDDGVEMTVSPAGASAEMPCDRGDRECINHSRRKRWEEKRRLRGEARGTRSASQQTAREERFERSEESKRRILERDLSKQVGEDVYSPKTGRSAKAKRVGRELGASPKEAGPQSSLREQIDEKLGKKSAEETVDEGLPATAQ